MYIIYRLDMTILIMWRAEALWPTTSSAGALGGRAATPVPDRGKWGWNGHFKGPFKGEHVGKYGEIWENHL